MVYRWTPTEENLLQLILEIEGLTFENIYNMFNTIALDLCLSQENREIPYYTRRQFPQLSIVTREARSRDAIITHYYRLVEMFPNLKKKGSNALYNETDDLYQKFKRQITEKLANYILAGENEQISDSHTLYGGGIDPEKKSNDDLSPYGGDHNNKSDFSSSNNNQSVSDMNTQIGLLFQKNKGRGI